MIKLDGRIISITQDNSGTVSFEFVGPEGFVFNLADYTVTFMVKHSKKEPDAKAIILKTYDNVQGSVLNVELLPEDTKAPVDFYWWSIQLTSGSYKNEALSGPFYIIEGVQD